MDVNLTDPNSPHDYHRVARTGPPGSLCVGVIIWSDDPELDPTVIADRNPVTLARTMAVMIHEMINDSDGFAGATEFLASNPPPEDWALPEDVDAWLEALRETTPYPAYSFHQIPVTDGADDPAHTVVNRDLENALREREQFLDADTPTVSQQQQSGPRQSL